MQALLCLSQALEGLEGLECLKRRRLSQALQCLECMVDKKLPNCICSGLGKDTVSVSVTSVAGGETVWTLPRSAILSDCLACLNLQGPESTRSLASFDVCSGSTVLGFHHRFDQDCCVVVVARDKHPTVDALFEMLDYPSSVLPVNAFLPELHERLKRHAEKRGVSLSDPMVRGFAQHGVHFPGRSLYGIDLEDPSAGLVRQFLRRWIESGLLTLDHGRVAWHDCCASHWKLVKWFPEAANLVREIYQFRRFNSTASDICHVLAECLPFADQQVLFGWTLRCVLCPSGHVLQVNLLQEPGHPDPVVLPSNCTTMRLELVLFRPEPTEAQHLFRLGRHETDNVHIHFKGGKISPELERWLRRVDPGFPQAGASGLPGHDLRLEISRSIK